MLAYLLWPNGIQVINDERLRGRMALRAYQTYGPSSLYHGSHRSPQYLTPFYNSGRRPRPVLKPQQAFWVDQEGHTYRDGEPAICAMDTFGFPILRSLLNREHIPGFKGLVFTNINDKDKNEHNFTSQEFLAELKERKITGNVYMLARSYKPEYQNKYLNQVTHTAWEYRIFEDTYPRAWAQTAYEDLPADLMVIGGETPDIYEFIKHVPDFGLM